MSWSRSTSMDCRLMSARTCSAAGRMHAAGWQTAAATLLRFAPAQGRGLILYADPAYPNGLIVFSSLGMGSGYPQGKVVTDIAILGRARRCQQSGPNSRGFREAAPLPTTSWGSFGM